VRVMATVSEMAWGLARLPFDIVRIFPEPARTLFSYVMFVPFFAISVIVIGVKQIVRPS